MPAVSAQDHGITCDGDRLSIRHVNIRGLTPSGLVPAGHGVKGLQTCPGEQNRHNGSHEHDR
jgi:hypothetical protein